MKKTACQLCILLPIVASYTAAYAQAFVEDQEYLWSWGLPKINPLSAYKAGYTTVAVVDSGLDRFHHEFANKVHPNSANFVNDGLAEDDFSDIDRDKDGNFSVGGHGTHVSGTIAAARNGLGMHGVAYNAQILAPRTIVNNNMLKDEVAAINTVTMQAGSRLLVDTSTSLPLPANQGSTLSSATITESNIQRTRTITALNTDLPRLQLTGDQGRF